MHAFIKISYLRSYIGATTRPSGMDTVDPGAGCARSDDWVGQRGSCVRRGCVARIGWPGGWYRDAGWRRRVALVQSRMLPLPFKLNHAGRHHIPRQTHKVTNWPAYDASLRQRGSLTVWLSDEAIAAWRAEPRTTRGGQPWYSPLAILTALTLRAVFRLALRQTEGLIGSVIHLLGLDRLVPDHTTLRR